MNKLLTLFLSLIIGLTLKAQTNVMKQDMFADMAQNDKAVIIAVHSGTADKDARKKSLQVFNERLKKEFPQVDFREAWTSRTLIKQLANQGEIIPTPIQLLRELKSLGYTHVLIQPSHITDGKEVEHLQAEVLQMRKHFKHIRVGSPLLSSKRDFELAVLATAAVYAKEKNGNILVFKGEKDGMNTAYTMIDHMQRSKGLENMYIVTLDELPDTEYLIRELDARKEKKVNLIPCLFPNEDAVMQRISLGLKSELEKAGHKVSVTFAHLGESTEILDLYMEHARYARMNRVLTATEQTMIEAAY